jgi:O-antigen/teichoic acid export membrane protein
MQESLRRLHADSLFRNSFYLMLATGVMAGFGFFFWLLSAHLVTTEEIGIATTLISVMNIISIFSLIGFDSAIVRFLAHSTQKNEKLNTSIILVSVVALFLGSIFVVFVDSISPQLSFIRDNIFVSLAFVFFCAMSAVNILTDSVFLAYRQTKYSLIINTIFSFVRMLLPLAFVSWGAFGIFFAAAVGQTVGLFLSVFVMVFKFNYEPSLTIDMDIVKQVWKYCFGNYFAGALNLIPVLLLPIIITNHLGLKEAAYFYIVMMIGNLLYAIPQATTKSLFAEGSFSIESIGVNIRKSVNIILALLLPAILVLLVGGKFLLGFFGKSYSADGIDFLYLIAVSGIAVGGYSMFNSLFRVRKKLFALVAMNVCYAGTIVVFTYTLLPLGLIGIGLSWLAGNLIACAVGYFLL